MKISNGAKKNLKVLILGKGKIGEGIKYFFKKQKPSLRIDFFSKENEIKDAMFLISALPGDTGEKGLNLALKFKKDLIDVSDLDHPFYLRFKKEIEKMKIRVFPGCGFSPGLTNLICGHECSMNQIKKIEILAGSLSKSKFFFPFLWCFEDLIEGHMIKARLIRNGKKILLPPFAGYRKEKIAGIDAESYFLDGLSSLPYSLKTRNMGYRVLRPYGFFSFFQFLENHGFLKKENKNFTKKTLEKEKIDNLTLAKIKFSSLKKNISWEVKSFSKKKENLNSMQKITSILPSIVAKMLLEDKIERKGIIFLEDFGRDKNLFKEILKEIKKEKILITSRTLNISGLRPL